MNLRDCPVLATPPPPTIVHTGAGEDSSDQAAYVTSPAPAPALAASLGLVLAAVARLLEPQQQLLDYNRSRKLHATTNLNLSLHNCHTSV